jgi:hypothetical protein
VSAPAVYADTAHHAAPVVYAAAPVAYGTARRGIFARMADRRAARVSIRNERRTGRAMRSTIRRTQYRGGGC